MAIVNRRGHQEAKLLVCLALSGVVLPLALSFIIDDDMFVLILSVLVVLSIVLLLPILQRIVPYDTDSES